MGNLKTRILIVDDHPLIREGLAARIAHQAGMEVCGEAADVDEALLQVKSLHPDLVIVDIQLGKRNGIELIKEIHSRFPSVKMLVVSAFQESLFAERALRAGANGYINKQELQDNVVNALRTVAAGERYLSSAMTQKLIGQAINRVDSAASDPIQRLSDRELEVFQLIGHGQTTRAIANQLHLSVHTIDTHREKIRRKLGLKHGAELMQRAVQWVFANN
jgi:DNA-binding NarL/FixJ family response regulator